MCFHYRCSLVFESQPVTAGRGWKGRLEGVRSSPCPSGAGGERVAWRGCRDLLARGCASRLARAASFKSFVVKQPVNKNGNFFCFFLPPKCSKSSWRKVKKKLHLVSFPKSYFCKAAPVKSVAFLCDETANASLVTYSLSSLSSPS